MQKFLKRFDNFNSYGFHFISRNFKISDLLLWYVTCPVSTWTIKPLHNFLQFNLLVNVELQYVYLCLFCKYLNKLIRQDISLISSTHLYLQNVICLHIPQTDLSHYVPQQFQQSLSDWKFFCVHFPQSVVVTPNCSSWYYSLRTCYKITLNVEEGISILNATVSLSELLYEMGSTKN